MKIFCKCRNRHKKCMYVCLFAYTTWPRCQDDIFLTGKLKNTFILFSQLSNCSISLSLYPSSRSHKIFIFFSSQQNLYGQGASACIVAVIELNDWQSVKVNIDPKHQLGERCTEVQVRLTHYERSVCLIDLVWTPECLTPCHQKMNV